MLISELHGEAAVRDCFICRFSRQAGTALKKEDGISPDEHQLYLWIKAAFQHFFNNVQKDPVVQAAGLRSCRQVLAYLLRNRVYVGEVIHKGRYYPGEHDPIIAQAASMRSSRS